MGSGNVSQIPIIFMISAWISLMIERNKVRMEFEKVFHVIDIVWR